MESFYELSVCMDPSIRQSVSQWIRASERNEDNGKVVLPLEHEMVMHVASYLYENHAVEFKEPAPRRSLIQQHNPNYGDTKPEIRTSLETCHSASPLWDPTGPKGLNATEKARTKAIELCVTNLAPSSDEEDSDANEAPVAEEEKDWYWDWEQFCLEFDKDLPIDNNKKANNTKSPQAKRGAMEDTEFDSSSDGLDDSLNTDVLLGDEDDSVCQARKKSRKNEQVPNEIVVTEAPKPVSPDDK